MAAGIRDARAPLFDGVEPPLSPRSESEQEALQHRLEEVSLALQSKIEEFASLKQAANEVSTEDGEIASHQASEVEKHALRVKRLFLNKKKSILRIHKVANVVVIVFFASVGACILFASTGNLLGAMVSGGISLVALLTIYLLGRVSKREIKEAVKARDCFIRRTEKVKAGLINSLDEENDRDQHLREAARAYLESFEERKEKLILEMRQQGFFD